MERNIPQKFHAIVSNMFPTTTIRNKLTISYADDLKPYF